MRPALRIGLLFALLGGWAVWMFTSGSSRPNVLVVVVDTLRQDHLGLYGPQSFPCTPELDDFVSESTIWDGLTCSSSWTMPSMATLWTGLDPNQHGVMRMVGSGSRLQEDATLAKAYRDAGYKTACVMGNFLLRADRGVGFNRSFDYWDDSVTKVKNPHQGSTASMIASKAVDLIERMDNQGSPWFMVLHFFDPHASYEDHVEWNFLDSNYRGWVKSGLANKDYREHQEACSDADREQLDALYSEEIAAVDKAFGEIVNYLKSAGDWESTSVVFTADHGEELGESGYIGHTRNLSPAITSLPLMIRDVDGFWPENFKVTGLAPQKRLFSTLLSLGRIPIDNSHPVPLDWRNPQPEPCFVEVDFHPVQKDEAKRILKQAIVVRDGRLVRDLKNDTERWYPNREGGRMPDNIAQLWQQHSWWAE